MLSAALLLSQDQHGGYGGGPGQVRDAMSNVFNWLLVERCYYK